MSITINNYNELLEFIKRKDINSTQATEIVCKALKVIVLFEMQKDEIIEATEYHIKAFCQNTNNNEQPIFLTQKGTEFNINDIFN
jgi:hypothetical protein